MRWKREVDWRGRGKGRERKKLNHVARQLGVGKDRAMTNEWLATILMTRVIFR
jgi:hypothetical protein